MTKQKNSNKKEKFVACRRASDGSLQEFKSNSGKVYDYEMALEAVENGDIENAIPFTGKDGQRYIRGKNDGNPKTNLANLKEF